MPARSSKRAEVLVEGAGAQQDSQLPPAGRQQPEAAAIALRQSRHRRVEQRDFDLVRNSRPGAGRYFEHKWGFWRCEKIGTPTPAPVVRNCKEPLLMAGEAGAVTRPP